MQFCLQMKFWFVHFHPFLICQHVSSPIPNLLRVLFTWRKIYLVRVDNELVCPIFSVPPLLSRLPLSHPHPHKSLSSVGVVILVATFRESSASANDMRNITMVILFQQPNFKYEITFKVFLISCPLFFYESVSYKGPKYSQKLIFHSFIL